MNEIKRTMSSASRNRRFWVLTLLLVVVFWLAAFRGAISFHPYVKIETRDGMQITFLLKPLERLEECEATKSNVTGIMHASCPLCEIRASTCLTALDSAQKLQVSTEPIATPSLTLPNGVVMFESASPERALSACRESERNTSKNPEVFKCHPPNAPRAAPSHNSNFVNLVLIGILALVSALGAAWATCFFIVRYEHVHAHLSHDHLDEDRPQRFHTVPTPRIGGIALLTGLLGCGGLLMALKSQLGGPDLSEFGYLLIAGIPAFLGGLAEDITKRTSVGDRLLLSMLSGAIGAWLLGAYLNRMDIAGIDAALLWVPFAVAFTIFAVSGVVNAVNIIDGYNGLAGGFALIALVVIACVAARVGDMFLVMTALATIGAIAGFMLWNYPNGRIFLGDGGAYLIGFILAELSVLLVARNPTVSPWFPLLVMIYPIWETLFSIYRKRLVRKVSPGLPDRLHFHMLIYGRVLRSLAASRDPQVLLKRNSSTSPYLWVLTGLSAIPAAFAWNSTPLLQGFSLAFIAFYVWLYSRIVGLRVPRWLIT